MRRLIRLTRGAYGFLCRKYKSVLAKCVIAAICAFAPLAVSAESMASRVAEGSGGIEGAGASVDSDAGFPPPDSVFNLPAPGSSFTIDRDMTFTDENVSYNKIEYQSGRHYTLTLENSTLQAAQAQIEGITLDATNSSLSSSNTLYIGPANLADSKLSAVNRLNAGGVSAGAGDNILESAAGDIVLQSRPSASQGATLSLYAPTDQITSAYGITANNAVADYVTSYSDFFMENGKFFSHNLKESTFGPSLVSGRMELKNMDSQIGSIMVFGSTFVDGGKFAAGKAEFYNSASFHDSAVSISSLQATDFAVENGSLELGKDNDKTNGISGNLSLKNVKSSIGSLKVEGKTSVTGGSLKADSLDLQETVFDNASPEINKFTLAGPLTLKNNAVFTAGEESLGRNPLNIYKSRLNVEGNLDTDSLVMDQGTLSATGDVSINLPDFKLQASTISAQNVTMQDMASSGQSLIEASDAINAGSVTLHSGRLSLQGTQSTIGSILGNGSLNAHNLNVKENLSLSGGDMHLTGKSVVGDNLSLEYVNASVEDLTVQGQASLSATTISGRNVALARGGTLDKISIIEVQSLTANGDMTLSGNSEVLAGEMNLGEGQLVLDGTSAARVIVAVGAFGGGALTVDANSLLSIGANTPDWANMGMQGHRASAALGLWSPFRLGSGAFAAVGAGSLARQRAMPGANQVAFAADSLLITNASVASKDGAGAISAAAPAVANVEAGAKLHILDARKDGLYRVLGENIAVNYDGNAWQGDNVKTDSTLIQLERLGGDMLGWFRAKAPGASTVLPGLDPDIGGSVDDAGNSGQIPPEPDSVPRPPASNPVTPPAQPTPPQPENPSTPDVPGQPENPSTPGTPGQPDNPTSPENPNPPHPENPELPAPEQPEQPAPDQPTEPGQPDTPAEPDLLPQLKYDYTQGQLFLSRATNFWFIGHDAPLAAKTIESAARIFALGAVPEMTFAANQAGSAAMNQRTGANYNSGIQAMNAEGEIIENGKAWHGFALWISPLYKSVNGYSLTAGHWDVDINGGLGGVAIGGDYTFENALKVGMSFNIGGGYSQSGGELAETTNNMSFWGLGAYAGWNKGNFDVSADVAFTSTYNKIEQDLPRAMQMDDLKSDITAWALSAGMELGYTFRTSFVDIRPHAGARYTHIYNDAYDVNSGGTVLEGKARSQNVWTFPAGISLEKQFEFDNGWHLRPMLDFSVIPAAGDKKAWSEARFTGTDTWATMKDQFMDDISYRGSIGLEFDAGNLSLGLNYSMQAGMKTNSQTVMGTFAYTF